MFAVIYRDWAYISIACSADLHLIISSKLTLIKIYHEINSNVYFYVPRQYN